MILGAVLAGGRSSRFGSDKALALLDGHALIDHVIAALRSLDHVVVCGRDHPGITGLPDHPGPMLGPLGGISAALRYGRENGYRAVLTIPCDTPALEPAIIASLLDAGPSCYLRSLPVLGLWSAGLAEPLGDYLEEPADLSMRGWLRIIDATALDCEPPVNVNEPRDLDLVRGAR